MYFKKPIDAPKVLELKKKRKRIFRLKILILFLIVFVIFLGFCFLTFWEEVQITEIKIEGNKVIESESLNIIANNHLDKKFIFFFKKNNFYLYPKNSIKKDIKESFKRIEEVEVSLENINTLKISVKEREPFYTWCGEVVPEGVLVMLDQNCFFMDKTGFVFDEAPSFSEGLYLKNFGGIKGDPLGQYFAKEDFEKIVQIYDYVSQLDVNIGALYLNKEKEEVEIYLISNFDLDSSPKIIFSLEEDLVNQLEKLATAFSNSSFEERFNNEFNSLVYIDLRFKNRIFYKFKNE